MDTIGYIYYDNGTSKEAAHMIGGEGAAQSTRATVERSTAQQFDFEVRNYPGYGPKPMRYDVRQF